MDRYDEDNPIKEVSGGSIFSRLNRFEENDEYNLEKEMRAYRTRTSVNNVSNKNYVYEGQYAYEFVRNMGTFFIFAICFIIFFIVGNIWWEFGSSDINFSNNKKEFIEDNMYLYEVDESELTDQYDNVNLVRTTTISFENAGNIPSLYKYDKKTEAALCNFTESDERFKNAVNTVQVYYRGNIPEESIYKFTSGLTNRKFEYIQDLFGGQVYAINTENGYFKFVLIRTNTIIYGAGLGEYEDLF